MNNKLHILFICGWYPSRVLPTNGDFIERHALAVSLKHKVTVIHIITDVNCKNDIEIETKNNKNFTVHIAYVKPQKKAINKIKLFWKAYQLILKKVKKFDVIHLNEIYPFGILAKYTAKKHKVPYLISEHYTGYLKSSKIKISFFEKIISKIITKNASAICTVSNYLSTNMQNLGFKGNYVTVPNVVDTEVFYPNKKVKNSLKLVHVSSLKNEHKNITGMLRVAKLLETYFDYFEWTFIGNNGDEYLQFLNDLNIKKGKISFLEHQTQKQLATHLQDATLCISFSNYETFGIVITEAIACGTPVIATETGVALDLKETDFCKIIPVKDEDILLQEILNHKTTFANLDVSKMHHFIQQQYSKEVISHKFSLLYYQSLKK
ncbi:glycosyltransferase family 4 protein [Polaribacter aestuariivivens]|uniref:glycosyltransferase family 4 protein n=1 Tax=Polaribacter aestuariivivens TaxID=2304626 RepID=UPI003F496D1B